MPDSRAVAVAGAVSLPVKEEPESTSTSAKDRTEFGEMRSAEGHIFVWQTHHFLGSKMLLVTVCFFVMGGSINVNDDVSISCKADHLACESLPSGRLILRYLLLWFPYVFMASKP